MIRLIPFLVRLIIKIAIVAIALSCLSFAILQTKWAKEKARIALINLLASEGVHAKIEGLEGTLPFTWTIDAAEIRTASGELLTLSQIKIRLKVLPLLKKKISIDYLNIHTLNLPLSKSETTFDELKVTLRKALISLTPAFHLKIPRLTIEQLLPYAIRIDAQGNWYTTSREFLLHLIATSLETQSVLAELSINGSKQRNHISAQAKAQLENRTWAFDADLAGPWNTWEALLWEDVSPDAALQGKFEARLLSIPNAFQNLVSDKVDGTDLKYIRYSTYLPDAWKLSTEIAISSLNQMSLNGTLCSLTEPAIEGTLHARYEDTSWKGDLAFHRQQGALPFSSHTHIVWQPGTTLSLSDIAFSSEGANLHGELTFDLPHTLCRGTLTGQATQLDKFNLPIEGGIGFECTLETHELTQRARLHLFSKHLTHERISGEHFSILAEIHNLLDDPYGSIDFNASSITTPHLTLDQIVLRTTREGVNEEQWTFALNCSGELETPLSINTQGTWAIQPANSSLTLTHCSGEIAGHSFFLQEPCSFLFAPHRFALTENSWSVGEGSLLFSADFTEKKATAHIQMTHFPLSTAKLLFPRFTMRGTTTASGSFEATEENITGTFNAVLEKTAILYRGKEDPLPAKGSLQIHLDHRILQIHSLLTAPDGQILDASASLPLTYTVSPFSLSINPHEHLSAELVAEGKIEELFDFVNIGSHHITGLISSRLLLSQTLNSPALQGTVDWQQGSYENYYTGTILKDISVHGEAEKDLFKLTKLYALGVEGDLKAKGVLEFNAAHHFPYEITAELSHLHAMRFDLIDAKLTGPLHVTGTTQSATAQGSLIVTDATINIPDQLPYEIPNLPITFIHRPAHLKTAQVTTTPIFPLHLDLELSAEDRIFVLGKKLSSEWKGSVHLTGTNLAIGAKGKLDLLSGDYFFAGKTFKLTEGEILFNNKPAPSAYITLKGLLNLSDTEITAQLHGPLTSPQLTFQSNPHMSTSGILSHILFNKDISDISQIEAVQLAAALMDLSGGASPSVMEAIRKTLGIDRLIIVPTENNEIALQIGKYLTKGVLVTLSQSATSTQVIVEVELKKGFVFQAQTQEEQEGKFSLKWRRNY